MLFSPIRDTGEVLEGLLNQNKYCMNGVPFFILVWGSCAHTIVDIPHVGMSSLSAQPIFSQSHEATRSHDSHGWKLNI